METLNYYINTHGTIVFFLFVFFICIVLAALLFFTIVLSGRNNFFNKYMNYIFFPLTAVVFFGSIFGFSKIIDPFNEGGISEIFLTESGKEKRITVLLKRIHSMKVGSKYDIRLKSFDLKTGKPYRMIELIRRSYDYKYHIEPTDTKYAWGYSKGSGYKYIDLYKPEVKRVSNKKPEELGIRKLHIAERWYFNPVNGTLGFHIQAPFKSTSEKSILLLKPEFIEELNTETKLQDRRWVSHRSAAFDKYDRLISYLNSHGELIKQINVSTYFKRDKVKILKTFTTPKYIYIFLSYGGSWYYKTFVKGFTLKAFKTDYKTGRIIEVTNFI